MTFSERLLEEINNHPGQSAADLAKTLGVSSKDVTSAIYNDGLYGELDHDSELRWWPRQKPEDVVQERDERPRCPNCSRPIETKKNRYCDDCTSQVLHGMGESGYLTPIDFYRKFRPYDARETTWETKGGSGDDRS